MRCKHGWLHFWVPSMQVLWPLHWQGGQLVKNHCWFGQISSVRTFRTFVTGPLKPPGMQVPVPRFEPSSHQPQAGSSWNGEEEPEVIVRSAQTIRNNIPTWHSEQLRCDLHVVIFVYTLAPRGTFRWPVVLPSSICGKSKSRHLFSCVVHSVHKPYGKEGM